MRARTILTVVAAGILWHGQTACPAAPNLVNGWIMNDLEAARAEARKTGKPIFATIRCEN
jgi:hypothetical protein